MPEHGAQVHSLSEAELISRARAEPEIQPAKTEGASVAAAEPAGATRKRATRVWALAGAAAVALGALGWWLHARRFEETDDAQIEANISAVSPRVQGTVVAVHVVDNQRVEAGDVLAELDGTDLEVALAQAGRTWPRPRRRSSRRTRASPSRRRATSLRCGAPRRTYRTPAPTSRLPRRSWTRPGRTTGSQRSSSSGEAAHRGRQHRPVRVRPARGRGGRVPVGGRGGAQAARREAGQARGRAGARAGGPTERAAPAGHARGDRAGAPGQPPPGRRASSWAPGTRPARSAPTASIPARRPRGPSSTTTAISP